METTTDTQEQIIEQTPAPVQEAPQKYDNSEALRILRGETLAPVADVTHETESTPTPIVTDTPAFDTEAFIKEKSKGFFQSTDEIEKFASEFTNLKENPYSLLSEEEKKILHVFKTHENPQEYFTFQSKDFDAVDSLTLLEEAFIKENSDLPKEKALELFQVTISNKYPNFSEGSDTEAPEYILEKRALDKEANTIRADFKKQQEEGKITLPEAKSTEPTEEEIKQQEQYLADAKAKVESFSQIKFKVDATGTEISVDVAGKEKLESALANPLGYLDTHLSKDGKFDMDKFLRLSYFLENEGKISEELYLAGKESGNKTFVEELKNPSSLRPTGHPGTVNDKAATLALIRSHNESSKKL